MFGLTNTFCAFLSLSFRVRGLLAAFAFLIICGLTLPVSATQTNITGPAGSSSFGSTVTVLPNGNIVVTDPAYSIPSGAANVGAVRLYDGATLSVISTLVGSTANDNVGSDGIIILTNGNYIVRSPNWDNAAATEAGAATFCSQTTGCGGAVSATNSLVGSNADDRVSSGSGNGGGGIFALPNGNYVIASYYWNGTRGAATFGSGTIGISGTISAGNSLVGTNADDQVGARVTVLTNGNYVVSSTFWNGNRGAATFANASSGISGTISAANSLVGLNADDYVGNGGVTPLTNGNYVVGSIYWNGFRGAVTFGSGTSGVIGTISAANSLVGSLFNDQVGIGEVTALTNGNYVVRSFFWNGFRGAATFSSGTTGISGTISAANSLVGTNVNDLVSGGGIFALTNGNYVVGSTDWNDARGAATFGSGSTGISGAVSAANSLVGSNSEDFVSSSGITVLTNGNYVVCSSLWNADRGAATWGSGTTGISGTISSSNSLVGTNPNNGVGDNRTVALTNGNYVVVSQSWDTPLPAAIQNVGAATWGNGAIGTTGEVSSLNSLVGSNTNDQVGYNGTTVLPNGNYVVAAPFWNGNRGAATFGNGTTGISGAISSAISLVGTTPGGIGGANTGDLVGLNTKALTNGNYVVGSEYWNRTRGAVTWGNGASGITGTISSANSLVGSNPDDEIGLDGGIGGITVLTNGNYVVASPVWDNGAIADAGAYTFGNGASGTTGTITNGATGGNSVVGTVTNGVNTFAFDATRNRLFVGRQNSNTVSILFFNTTATSNGSINSAGIFDNGLPDALKNAIIPNGRTISLSGVSQIGMVSVDCTANLTGAAAANYIVGSVRRNYCAAAGASFVYPIGDRNNYSPLTASNVSGTGALTVSVVDQTLPGLPSALSVSRYWNLEGSGITTDLKFQYTAADVNGSESGYKVHRRVSDTNVPYATTINSAQHTATVTGISNFSPWGIGAFVVQAPGSQTYEGDVQSRPNGDGFVDSDDIQQIRRFSVGNNLPYQGNEFQRADCAPRSTGGDGFVDGDDVQQARRYSVGTDAGQLAGGPASIPPPMEDNLINNAIDLPFGKQSIHTKDGIEAAPAAFRVDAQNTSAGSMLVLPIRVDTVGNEAGYTFSIAFDSTKLTSPTVAIGNGGGDVIFNANNAGQIGFSVTSFSGGTITAGNNVALVNVTFTVAANAAAGTTPITFTDTPARRKASGVDPNNPITQPTYTGGTITIGGATAAGATVGGRVLTADGRGVVNAVVTLTDKNGTTQTARTTAFGYYRFSDVEAGQTYVAAVQSKRFQFAAQVVSVTDNLSELNFYSTGESGR